MFCKWCGIDSGDDVRCEWCGRPFAQSSPDQATTKIPPATTSMPPRTTAMPPKVGGIPQSKSIQVPSIETFGMRLERFLAVMLPVLAAGMLFAHYLTHLWLVPFFTLLFISGLMLGKFRVIGYYEDELGDVLILLGITLLIGPLFAVAIYALLSLARSHGDYSLLGLMLAYLVVRVSIGWAAHGWEETVGYLLTFEKSFGVLARLLQMTPVFALVGGWMCASLFRPLNE